MSFEHELALIADKDVLHRMIDDMQDGDKAVLLIDPAAQDETAHYAAWGNPTWAELNWMIDQYKKFVMS